MLNISLRTVAAAGVVGCVETSPDSSHAARPARTAKARPHSRQEHPSGSTRVLELRLYVSYLTFCASTAVDAEQAIGFFR